MALGFEQKDNRGALFVNDRKDSDRHPDRTGTAMIDGVMYYVSGWLKQGSKGQFLSLAFKPNADQPQREAPISERAMPKRPDPISSGRSPRDDMNDDIPFGPEFR